MSSLRGLLYAEFDHIAGPVLIFQTPADVVSAELFDGIAECGLIPSQSPTEVNRGLNQVCHNGARVGRKAHYAGGWRPQVHRVHHLHAPRRASDLAFRLNLLVMQADAP